MCVVIHEVYVWVPDHLNYSLSLAIGIIYYTYMGENTGLRESAELVILNQIIVLPDFAICNCKWSELLKLRPYRVFYHLGWIYTPRSLNAK